MPFYRTFWRPSLNRHIVVLYYMISSPFHTGTCNFNDFRDIRLVKTSSSHLGLIYIICRYIKETRYVTMNSFRKKNLFKSFVKVELSYVFTINMFSTAENYMERLIILPKKVFSLIGNYSRPSNNSRQLIFYHF